MAIGFEYDVFLSHSSKDKPEVRELAERLKRDRLRVWLDEWVIQPGDLISLAIEQGLESSRTLVLVMSDHSVGKDSTSEWVALERHTALFRDPTNQQRRFIPLRLDDCSIRDSLRQFAYIDWRDKHESEYKRLLTACRGANFPIESRVTQEEGKDASLWSLEKVFHGDSSGAHDVEFLEDGRLGIARYGNGYIRIWDCDNLKYVKRIDRPTIEKEKLIGGRFSRLSLVKKGPFAVLNSRGKGLVVDLRSGRRISELVGHNDFVNCIAGSSDGKVVATGSDDRTVRIWETFTGKFLYAIPIPKITSVAITPDGKDVVYGTKDGHLKLWNIEREIASDLLGHTSAIRSLVVSSERRIAVTGSDDRTVRLWNLDSKVCIASFEGHLGQVTAVAATADAKMIASGSTDASIRIWDSETLSCVAVIKGHKETITGISISADAQKLLSSSEDGTVQFWTISSSDGLVGRSRHKLVREHQSIQASGTHDEVVYTNAKVLLVGDSGVGKTGLAIRLTEERFEPTISTDAFWATQLKLPHDTSPRGKDREIWLWDFAGQADYRLIHQLFMNETTLAVLVFNPQSESPLEGLRQWDRDLVRAARREYAKLLVAGRCDRGGLMVSKEVVLEFARQRGFANYLETSALTGDGCKQLRDEIVGQINWDTVPWTTSPRIFKLLKDEILRMRDEGVVLLRMGELKQQLEMRLVRLAFETVADGHEVTTLEGHSTEDNSFTIEELRAVVGLLAGPGLVWKLEFGDIVMLQPEWINKYAAAVIRSIRAHFGEIGVIDEAKVLAGDLNYTMDVVRQEANDGHKAIKLDMQRLNPPDEAIVLRAMHQMFVDHGLCVREEIDGGGRQLIFPSYFKQDLPTDPGHPPILVNYQFDGHAEEIYATLVVQLWQTKAFENGDLWRYAADFKSVSGARLGLKMVRHEDKNPEISVYFDPDVQDDTKVTFIKYVHEHLLEKARDVVRLRAFVCPNCGYPVRDTDLAREILNEEGQKAEIRCQQRKCDEKFSLWDLIERKFASEEFQKKVRDLETKAKAAIDNESRELILEGHARVITGEAGQIYRGYTGSDHGIDGEIEFKDDLGQASGIRLYLQLKSGDSYLYRRKSDGAEIFQIKKQRWATYWREHAYPVMLVIRTSDGEIRWMNVTKYLEETSKGQGTPVKQIVFESQPFTALNLLRLRDRLLPVRERTLDIKNKPIFSKRVPKNAQQPH